MGRNTLQIRQLAAKPANTVGLQHPGLGIIRQPAAVVKDVHTGLGIPFGVQHLVGHRRVEILTV